MLSHGDGSPGSLLCHGGGLASCVMLSVAKQLKRYCGITYPFRFVLPLPARKSIGKLKRSAVLQILRAEPSG